MISLIDRVAITISLIRGVVLFASESTSQQAHSRTYDLGWGERLSEFFGGPLFNDSSNNQPTPTQQN